MVAAASKSFVLSLNQIAAAKLARLHPKLFVIK